MANAEQEDIGTLEVEKDGHFNADDSKFTGIYTYIPYNSKRTCFIFLQVYNGEVLIFSFHLP